MKLSYTAVRSVKFVQLLWRTVSAVSDKIKHVLTMNPSNSLPKWSEKKICPHKDLCMSVHSNLIHNNHKLETSQYLSTDDLMENG